MSDSPYSSKHVPNPDLTIEEVNQVKIFLTNLFGDRVVFTVSHYGENKELLMYIKDKNARTVYWKYITKSDLILMPNSKHSILE